MTATEKKILFKVEKMEAFARAALNEATAIRKELGGDSPSSPRKGKEKLAAMKVLENRRKTMFKNG